VKPENISSTSLGLAWDLD
jgi:RNase H-like domain found in reverse transcriptase/Reverse transcriptase (RNA-dependent DNA polymerase)